MIATKTITPETLTGCRIVIRNDVTSETTVKHSPQTAREAMENDGDVLKACEFAEHDGVVEHRDEEPEPIAVVVRQGEYVVRVHWYPVVDDLEIARRRLGEIFATHWITWRAWS